MSYSEGDSDEPGPSLNASCLTLSRGVTSAPQIASERLHCIAGAPARHMVQLRVSCLPGIHEGRHREQEGQDRSSVCWALAGRHS